MTDRLAERPGPVPPAVARLAQRIADTGGRLLVVGGWVRDALRGEAPADLDLEVYGLAPDRVTDLLGAAGFTPPVGRHFPVWRRLSDGIDVAMPRGLAAAGAGDGAALSDVAPAFDVETVASAMRGRDVTVNAMAWDPLAATLFDPLGGRDDLAARRLRAADGARFAEDPLRVLRVARQGAALDAEVDPTLEACCRATDPSTLPPERVAGELRRMLLELDRPWSAIERLQALGQLGVFPPIEALRDVPQDPEWHPEGDVYLHTGLVVDGAAERARSLRPAEAERLLWAALCHDLGKPETTYADEAGRIRSPAHDEASARIVREWLGSLRLAADLVEAVAVLSRHHLAPALFVGQGAGPRAYRRLARKLATAGLDMVELERVARVDHLGRTTPDALAGRFAEGEEFLERARAVRVERGVCDDVVRAADWMRAGVPAGPELGRLLRASRAVQDDTGWTEAARIMQHVRSLPRGEEASDEDDGGD